MSTNDLYIESTTATGDSGVEVDVVNTYKYNGSVWVQINSNDSITALADLADGKRTIFTALPSPDTSVDRDLLIPTVDIVSALAPVGGVFKAKEIYQKIGTEWESATKYTDDSLSNRRLFNGVWGTTPILADGTAATPKLYDVWAVRDRWYNTSGTSVVSIRPETSIKNAVYEWNGSSWIIIPRDQIPANIVWAGAASSLLTGPNGEITGWSYADGSGEQGTFAISAEKFYIRDGNNDANVPFSIDTTGGDNTVVFTGKVIFQTAGGDTLSQDDYISTIAQNAIEQVSVGDKNINITDNLIPTTSLVSDINNAGYQFIGTPSKSAVTGIDTFAEPQIILDSGDEVYSPYVDEVFKAYYYRFGIKGITNLDRFKVTTLNSSNIATYGIVTYTLDAGIVLNSSTWYVIDGIINPAGGNTSPSGSIRLADGTKIGTVNNYAMPVGSTKLVLGWIANCTISRMKLSAITADTITSSLATTDYVNTTEINGGRITTNSITANRLVNGGAGDGGFEISGGKFSKTIDGVSRDLNIYGGAIGGAEIYGGDITGTTITGATIDATSTITTPVVYTTAVRIRSEIALRDCQLQPSMHAISATSTEAITGWF
jgi:hypothetical protein